jgi:type I restriction enzyme M protein
VPLGEADHAKNNFSDVLARWSLRNGSELDRPRTAQSFAIPKADIVAQNYDLSISRYKEIIHEESQYRSPLDIIADLESLESEIQSEISTLKKVVG